MKGSMNQRGAASERFSPWWRYGVLVVFIVGFGVLIWVSATAYKVAPPIPDRVIDPSGTVVFTGDELVGSLILWAWGAGKGSGVRHCG
jgi:nitric oxide reductase large subunit